MTKLEVFDETRLTHNPFQYSLTIPVTQVVDNLTFELPKEDEADGVILNKSFFIERTKSVKIYYCKECKGIIYNCSDRAQRLYLYILYNLNPNKDYIQINTENYMSKNGIKSINTYKEAVKELVRYGFLSYTEYKTVFWINPNLFFSGNRLGKYEDKIDVVETWVKANSSK